MYAEDGSCGIRSEQPRTLFLTLPFSEELINHPRKQMQENPLSSPREDLAHDRNEQNKWENCQRNMVHFFLQSLGESGLQPA